MNTSLEMDGERYLPWLPSKEWDEIHYDHLNRYYFASRFVRDKVVLDLASGEGYGSAMFASTASNVTGVDIDSAAVLCASNKYQNNNLKFLQGNACEIPIEGHEIFDVITSFETLEHIDENDQKQMIAEFGRLIKNDGILIISTPNHEYTRDIMKYDNPFHKKELTLQEFDTLLAMIFANRSYYGQRNYYSNQIAPLGREADKYCEILLKPGGEAFIEADFAQKLAQNYICVASKTAFSSETTATFLTDINNTAFHNLQNSAKNLLSDLRTSQVALADANSQLADVNAKLSHTNELTANLNSRCTEINLQLADTNARFAEANIQFADINDQLIYTKIQLTDAHAQLGATKIQLADAHDQLGETKIQLANAQAQLGDTKIQLTDTKTQLADAQVQFADTKAKMDTALAEKQDQIEDLQAELAQINGQLNRTKIHIEALNDYINAFEQSTSWKITRPFRFIMQKIIRRNLS